LQASKTLNSISHSLGGGGAYSLIYFHCRILKPKIAVETGVANGWSSFAILESLRKNGQGKLYLSDFPYFKLKDPEQFIG
jgi:predicted O-methyltransferase YrrM